MNCKSIENLKLLINDYICVYISTVNIASVYNNWTSENDTNISVCKVVCLWCQTEIDLIKFKKYSQLCNLIALFEHIYKTDVYSPIHYFVNFEDSYNPNRNEITKLLTDHTKTHKSLQYIESSV